MDTLVCEQRQLITQLSYDVAARMKLETDMAESDIRFFNNLHLVDNKYGFILQNCSVKRDDIIQAISKVDIFVEREMDRLKVCEEESDKAL
jgi:hypothetical protein